MPESEEILSGLALAANNFKVLSILWHVIVLGFLAMLLSGKRPANKLVMFCLTLPLVSVGIIALLISNPFNAIVFLIISVILWIVTIRFPGEKITLEWSFFSVTGFLMILFGLFYPHFLEDAHPVDYLYAAPVGLIPCPTLSLVIGFTMLLGGFRFRKWMWYLSCLGLFYGIVGVLRLKVYLDVVLIAGALILLMQSVMIKKEAAPAENQY